MATRSFCDNCNTECRPRTVTITWAQDDYLPQRKLHGLCEDCARRLADLDMAGFAQAHQDRPRTLGLP